MTAQDGRTDLSRIRRQPLAGFLVGVAGVAAIALVGFAVSPSGRTGPALLLVLPVLLAAVVGGRTASLAVAAVAALAFATAFLPPIGSPLVRFADDAMALAVFVVVAFAISFLLAVTLDAERRRRAADEARLVALEAVDEHRRALLRSVSHELRTPLGVVHGTATELLDGDVLHTAAARRQLLSLLVDETGRLERIVANLLAMSRIDAQAWEAERELLDVGDLVASAVRRASGLLRGTPVTIDVRPDLPPVYADPVQMDLVLANLLENAARHSPDGRPVTVVAERAVGFVQMSVIDHGCGVSRDLGDRAFEPFVTGPGGTRVGIGLALCRTIVSGHGGTIRLEASRHGEGTAAVVQLPAA